MDKITHYRNCITQILEQHRHSNDETGDVESLLCCDTDRDRYQLMRVGWQHLTRIHYTVLHLDIRNEQIWLQHNATESDIGADLIALGIPKEDIILGLQPSYKRPYTGYGVARVQTTA